MRPVESVELYTMLKAMLAAPAKVRKGKSREQEKEEARGKAARFLRAIGTMSDELELTDDKGEKGVIGKAQAARRATPLMT